MRGKLDLAVLSLILAAGCGPGPDLKVKCPAEANVFDRCELDIGFSSRLRGFARLPDTQVHDAYDADRNGVYVRLTAEFRHRDGGTVAVPGFAMKEELGGPWRWRVRWSPRRAGEWQVTVRLEGRAALEAEPVSIAQRLQDPIIARTADWIEGPLVAPAGDQHPGYLRRLRPDGGSDSLWLFGACRAWVVELQDKHNDWHPHEWLNRESELLAPMRGGGFNLLNQWMAPWEFLLVHHDRAEHWKQPGGNWKRSPILDDADWTPYQCYDQGRADAFDDLVEQCEGGPRKETVRLLLSPLPHQCLQVREHPWGSQESGWSPENDAGRQLPSRLNGFSGFKKKMSVWEFFDADPSRPLDDKRSQLFDHQANFYRYVIARWGCSRAIGVWVLIDELDAVGDVVGVMSEKKGWWGHPQCGRWLADMIRMFRGKLKRSDGMTYGGDPFRHPVHVATTSFGGQAGRGGNIDWTGGPADARPDVFGWHWYPGWAPGSTWSDVWERTIDGVASYSRAPIGPPPRLISEFGAPDRNKPDDEPSRIYPTLYHHAIWSAIFSGQAGTPMDWDDGKQFGELRWRKRKGIFDREHYPIDHVAQLRALRRFLKGLRPEDVVSCAARNARVRCVAGAPRRLHALHSIEQPDAVYGWLYSTGKAARFRIEGLQPGTYRLTWHDPWTGEPAGEAQSVTVRHGAAITLSAGPALAKLRAAAKPFPAESRLAKGNDVAFKLTQSPPR